MFVPRTLTRYVLCEAAVFMAVGLVGLGSILVGQNLLRKMLDMVPLGLTAFDALRVTLDLTMMMAGYVLPVGLLFGTLAGLGRLASDNEIQAMRSLGVGRRAILVPLLTLALFVAGGTSLLMNYAQPLGRRNIRTLLGELAARGGFIQAEAFTDLDRAGSRVIFADSRIGRQLDGVLLSDRSDPERPFVVASERGEFRFDEASGKASLLLERGDVHFEAIGNDAESQRIAFEHLAYVIDLSPMIGGGVDRLTARDFTTPELRDILAHFDRHGEAPEEMRVRTRSPYEREVARRSAFAPAAIVLTLLAIPLATRFRDSAASRGLMACIALAVGYYVSLSAAEVLTSRADVSPMLAMWVPNIIFGVAAIWLWLRRDLAR